MPVLREKDLHAVARCGGRAALEMGVSDWTTQSFRMFFISIPIYDWFNAFKKKHLTVSYIKI